METVELFYLDDDDVPSGAVVSRIAPDVVSCSVRFSTPDGDQGGGHGSIRVDGSIRDWTAFTFTADGVTTRGRREGTDVTVAGETAVHEGLVVPGYGLSALVLDLVRGTEDSVDLLLLEESAASPRAVAPARLVRAGTEDVTSPVAGRLTGCARVELTVSGRRTNTYWTRDGVVVASDWNGARSFALPRAAAEGLRATTLREFHDYSGR